MGSSVLRKLAGIVAACLVASVCGSCCKSYVQAVVPRCPKMNEAMAAEMLTVTDSPTVDYTADETIPYCKGIDELLDE